MINKLAPFNPTSEEGISIALDLLNLSSSDVLLDIGCGDGRLIFEAASKTNVTHCLGIEYDEKFYKRAVSSMKTQTDRITLIHGDAVQLLTHINDLNGVKREEITAIFMYLVPEGIQKMKDLFKDLKSIKKVCTYMFSVKEWKPIEIKRTSKGIPVYLYEL